MEKQKYVTCKKFNMWNTSISTLFNVSPKVNVTCGKCKKDFSKRFDLDQFEHQLYPMLTCPHCKTKNRIPIVLD